MPRTTNKKPKAGLHKASELDQLNLKIIELLLAGISNNQIASKTGRPLSTIQRRRKQILDSGLIKAAYEINYQKFGFKKGLLHIYLKDGDMHSIAQKLLHIKGVIAVSIHLGNSDVVADYACKDANDLLNLIADVKKYPSVDRIVWSEEVKKMLADDGDENMGRSAILKDIQSAQGQLWKD